MSQKDTSKDNRAKTAEPMIVVDHVDMVFNIANEQLNSLKEYFIALLRGKLFFKEFKALEDINFTVNRGDVYGIVGTNGSGKSTMLKVIAGVLEPTSGSCEINGTIAPLIELGAGFDPDLTARENVYLNGSLLGYSRKFIDEHFDSIVEFAEVQDFIDMPLKNYSSGMTARIAFAIATATTPDILVVDEALSVGDFMFQEKCERRINDLVKNHGTTLLFVSHSIDQVERVCKQALWIEKGHKRMEGTVEDVCFCYRNMEFTDFVENNDILEIKRATADELKAPVTAHRVIDALWRCAGKPSVSSSSGEAGAIAWGSTIGLASPSDGDLDSIVTRQDLISLVHRFSLWRKPSLNDYEPADDTLFCDNLPSNPEKRKSVEWALHHRLISGIKNDDGSRALALGEPASLMALAKMISNLYKNAYSYPADVSPTDWYVLPGYYDYVTEHGILSGYGTGLFGPNDPVTRGQAATFFWRGAGKPDVLSGSVCADVKPNEFYTTAIAWALSLGLMKADEDGLFHPDDPISHKDLASLAYRYATKDDSATEAAIQAWCDSTGIFKIETSDETERDDERSLRLRRQDGKSAITDVDFTTRALMTRIVAIIQRDLLGIR